MANLLEIKNITKHYVNENSVSKGINDITLSFNKNEFVCLTGSSGSGKTTLLNILGGLAIPDDGEMYFNGNFIDYLQKESIEKFRKENISFIFQEYKLIPSLTVLENVLIPLELQVSQMAEAKKLAREIIERVGLSHRINKKVRTLSGGEQQRVVIARALARDSKILICDEPTGNLDKENGQSIIRLLHQVSKNKLVIFVTHNEQELVDVMTRKIVLNDGALLTDEVINSNSDENENKQLEKNFVLEKPAKHNNLLRLIFKYFFSNPRLAVLMIFVFFVFGFLLLSSIGLINATNNELLNLPRNNNVTDEYVKKVRRFDGLNLSDEEINSISQKTGAKHITDGYVHARTYITNSQEYALDTTMSFFPDNYFSTISTDYGRKIESPYDCYLVIDNPKTSQSLLNKQLSIASKQYLINETSVIKQEITFTVVGLVSSTKLPKNIETNDKKFIIYANELNKTHPDFFNVSYLLNSIFELNFNYEDAVDPKKEHANHLALSYSGALFIINKNPSFTKQVDYYNLITTAEEEETELLLDSSKINKSTISIYDRGHLFTSSKKKIVFNLKNEYKFRKIKKSEAISYNEQVIPDFTPDQMRSVCVISYDLYQEIIDNVKHFEAYFITSKSDLSFFKTINSISSTRYGVTGYSNQEEDRDSLFRLVDYVIKVVISIIIFVSFVIYLLIMSLIFRRIFQVKQKDYNILRTLGASRKNILSFVFIENLIVMHISFLIFVVLTFILKYSLKFIPRLSAIFDLNIISYLVLYFLLLIMALYSSYKYVIKLYRKEIAKSLSKGGSKK